MRIYLPLIEDALNLLVIKDFKIKPEQNIVFEDVEFMSANEKMKVYKKWIQFLNTHFKQTQFTKHLYNHLYQHCGYIAHYNLNGFYGNYFGHGLHSTLENFDKNNLHAKKIFYDVYRDLFKSRGADTYLKGFVDNWNGTNHMGVHYRGDYEDLNTAMRDILIEYYMQWEDLISTANSKLEQAKELKVIKEKKLQRQRLLSVIDDANSQLDLIENEISEEIVASQSKDNDCDSMTLFDFYSA